MMRKTVANVVMSVRQESVNQDRAAISSVVLKVVATLISAVIKIQTVFVFRPLHLLQKMEKIAWK